MFLYYFFCAIGAWCNAFLDLGVLDQDLKDYFNIKKSCGF